MIKMIKSNSVSDDAGVTLIEVIIAMVLTAFLAIGLTRIASASLTAMAYTETTAIAGANSASLHSIFNHDLAETNAIVVPSSNFVNSNVCMTLSNTLVKPLLTLSTQSNISPTFASWDSTASSATFTYTGPQIAMTVGQLVDIAGMSETLLNATGLMLVSSGANTFTLLYPAATSTLFGTGSETESFGASAIAYKWVGYELHPNASTGTTDLWRVQCSRQGETPDANAEILRAGFDPNIDWTNAIKCTASTMATYTCLQDILLTATNANAESGITFTIPATVPASSPLYQQHSAVYQQEVLMGATSLF